MYLRQDRILRAAAGLIALFLGAAALAQQPKNLDEAFGYDGLQKISIKGIDIAYALPGATLAGYTKVMIDPISVRFRKDWKPTVPGSTRGVSPDEQQRIREAVAKVVYDAFVEELKKSGYSLTAAPGEDVLRVQAAIVNLYITAPDVMTPGRSRVYTVSSGEMTVVAELSDADSGQVVARVAD